MRSWYVCYCQDKKAQCIGPFTFPEDADKKSDELKKFNVLVPTNIFGTKHSAIQNFNKNIDEYKKYDKEC